MHIFTCKPLYKTKSGQARPKNQFIFDLNNLNAIFLIHKMHWKKRINLFVYLYYLHKEFRADGIT